MIQVFSNFMTGVRTPFVATKIILKNKKLLAWSALPVTVTILLYVWGFLHVQQSIQEWLFNSLTSRGWDSWIITVIAWLSKLLIILVGAITFSFAAGIVSAPFNDFLAEAAERYTLPPFAATESPTLGKRLQLIGLDIVKTIAGLGFTIVGFILSLIPILNILGFLIIVLVMTFNYVSYSQTRRGLGLYGAVRFLFQNFALCVGFGMVITLAFSVPILSVLILPIAVVGGTQLVASRRSVSVG